MVRGSKRTGFSFQHGQGREPDIPSIPSDKSFIAEGSPSPSQGFTFQGLRMGVVDQTRGVSWRRIAHFLWETIVDDTIAIVVQIIAQFISWFVDTNTGATTFDATDSALIADSGFAGFAGVFTAIGVRSSACTPVLPLAGGTALSILGAAIAAIAGFHRSYGANALSGA
jgi:hypothetical protein